MRVLVTYREIHEATAIRVFYRLRKDPELSRNENIYFYKPKKEEVFEYIYQTKFAELLVKNGLLSREPAKKLAKGKKLSLKDWNELKEEWLSLWERCFKGKTFVKKLLKERGVEHIERVEVYDLLYEDIPRKWRGDARTLIECALKAHEFALKDTDKELIKKAKKEDCYIIIELHSSSLAPENLEEGLYDGAVMMTLSENCLWDPLIREAVNLIWERRLALSFPGFASTTFPEITLEIYSKYRPGRVWYLPRPFTMKKNGSSLLVLPRMSGFLTSRKAVEVSYPTVKSILKIFASVRR